MHGVARLILGLVFWTHVLPSRADELPKIADDPRWLRILHFRDGRSEVDRGSFFFSPHGHEDPRAELTATLDAFRERRLVKGYVEQEAACAFPERFAFLSAQHSLPVPEECKDFQEWRKRLSSDQVSLVYSSAYAGNPASMFGHTFLRLHKGAESSGLMGYGANFAAEAGDTATFDAFDSLLYAWRGLFGGYDGRYQLAPYYMKVNDYSSSENRDLVEYDLDFSPEQRERLVRHLWELYSNVSFDYYFVDENCSYQLLRLLEVARDDLNLEAGPYYYVMPVETLRSVGEVPGFVTAIRRRPSPRKNLQKKIDALPEGSRDAFWALAEEEAPISENTDLSALAVYADYLNFQKLKEGAAEFDEGLRARQHQALLQLARRGGAPSDERPVQSVDLADDAARDDRGHKPVTVGLGAWLHKNEIGALSLDARWGYHDAFDPPGTFVRGGFIHGFQPQLLIRDVKPYVSLERFLVVEITSLQNFGRLESRFSWQLHTGLERLRDAACDACLAYKLQGGGGLSTDFSSEHSLAYALVLANLDVSASLVDSVRAGPALRVGWLWNPHRAYRLQLEWTGYWDALSGGNTERLRQHLQLAQAFNPSQDWSLQLSISLRSAQFSVQRYF